MKCWAAFYSADCWMVPVSPSWSVGNFYRIVKSPRREGKTLLILLNWWSETNPPAPHSTTHTTTKLINSNFNNKEIISKSLKLFWFEIFEILHTVSPCLGSLAPLLRPEGFILRFSWNDLLFPGHSGAGSGHCSLKVIFRRFGENWKSVDVTSGPGHRSQVSGKQSSLSSPFYWCSNLCILGSGSGQHQPLQTATNRVSHATNLITGKSNIL